MWVPKKWSDLERSIGVQAEGDAIDFKRELPPKEKLRGLAKDVAAMSVGGGVIVIGVDESNGEASKITPIQVKGVPEQVQQIVDSNVTPPVSIDISVLRRDPGDDEGVVVIAVPVSWSAPHQYEYRYPARAGLTSRSLTEREVESLYERRHGLQGQGLPEVGLTSHRYPPGVEFRALDDSVAMMRIHVRPVGYAKIPTEPHLGVPLGEGAKAAIETVIPWLTVEAFIPKAFDFLRQWTPAGSTGWRAGAFAGDADTLAGGVSVGAFYQYGNGFSFTTTMSLAGNLEPDAPSGARCTFEHLWTIETLGLLSLAGHFYNGIPEASLLRVDLELGGLLGSTSWQTSRGLAFNSAANEVTENQYVEGGTFSARDLASDPRDATRELLDRFMVPILSAGTDIVAWVQNPNG